MSPWLIVENDGLHDIEVSKIITVTELSDPDLIQKYTSFFRKKLTAPKPRASKDIGFVGNVNEFKKILEKIYKDTDSASTEHNDL